MYVYAHTCTIMHTHTMDTYIIHAYFEAYTFLYNNTCIILYIFVYYTDDKPQQP